MKSKVLIVCTSTDRCAEVTRENVKDVCILFTTVGLKWFLTDGICCVSQRDMANEPDFNIRMLFGKE